MERIDVRNLTVTTRRPPMHPTVMRSEASGIHPAPFTDYHRRCLLASLDSSEGQAKLGQELMLPIHDAMGTLRDLYRANPPPTGGADNEQHMQRLRDEAWRITNEQDTSRNQSSGGRSGRSGPSEDASGGVREVLRAEEALAGESLDEQIQSYTPKYPVRWLQGLFSTRPEGTDGSESRPPNERGECTPVRSPSPCLLQVTGHPPPPLGTPMSRSTDTTAAVVGNTRTNTPTVCGLPTCQPEPPPAPKADTTTETAPGPYVVSKSDYKRPIPNSEPTPKQPAGPNSAAAACAATSDEP